MIAVITTTVSTQKDALKIGKKLLDDHLIVCSNINKTLSQYYWKGQFHEEEEFQLSVKTTIEKKEQAIKCINMMHPYETPMIVSKNFEISNSYKAWMDQLIG